MNANLLQTETNLSLETLINNFMMASQVEGKSERTLQQYVRVLKPFTEFVKCSSSEIKAADIREFLATCRKKGWSDATIWTFYKELNVFFNFCYRESHLSENPMKLVNKPRMAKVFPRILTEDEIKQLLKSCKGTSFLAKRNKALIALMFDSGLRAGEVCSLKLNDVSLTNLVLKVFGKGSKERIIPFSKETAKLLFSYLKTRGNPPFEERFFITRTYQPFNPAMLCKLLKNTAKKAGVNPAKVSPHVLRHSFATTWIKNGGDGKRLQHILGHADGRVTDVYIHLSAKDLREAHREFSPLTKLK